jgi:hypothetical protein
MQLDLHIQGHESVGQSKRDNMSTLTALDVLVHRQG